MKQRRIPFAAGLALLALGYAGIALVSCAGPSPWLRPQGELVQLERQAAAAKELATAPRTLAALDDCIRSAQDAVHAIDVLLNKQEKLRRAKQTGVAIPELERAVAQATAEAEEAEATARKDCARAGVKQRAAPRAAAADGGAAADLVSAPAAAPARDLPPPAPAADMALAPPPAPAPPPDGGGR